MYLIINKQSKGTKNLIKSLICVYFKTVFSLLINDYSQNFVKSCLVAFAILNEQFRTLSTPASKQAHSSCSWVVLVFNDHNADFTTSSSILYKYI